MYEKLSGGLSVLILCQAQSRWEKCRKFSPEKNSTPLLRWGIRELAKSTNKFLYELLEVVAAGIQDWQVQKWQFLIQKSDKFMDSRSIKGLGKDISTPFRIRGYPSNIPNLVFVNAGGGSQIVVSL